MGFGRTCYRSENVILNYDLICHRLALKLLLNLGFSASTNFCLL
jgi:hypothetical protein